MSLFVFKVKVQLSTNFSIRRGIKLKFGGGVNSETELILILYFMSTLPNKMTLIKIMGFYVIFYKFYSTSVQQKCRHGNIADDILINVSASNDL